MAILQKAMTNGFAKAPAQLLDKFLKDKFVEKGLKIPSKVRAAVVEHILHGKGDHFSWDDGPGSEEVSITLTEEDSEELGRAIEAFVANIPDLVERLTKTSAKTMLKALEDSWPEQAAWEVAVEEGFKERLEDRWGEGLDYLRMMLLCGQEIGADAHKRLLRSRRRKNLPFAQSALIRLHTRACQVAKEIITLMENGLANGAMARWRTLYEISVVSDVVKAGGDAVGERLLAHDVVDELSGIKLYQRTQVPLGYEPPSARTLAAAEKAQADAVAKYGAAFAGSYGWAAEFLNHKDPKFTHLEEAAGRTAMKPTFKMASYSVHAGARSLFFSFSHLEPFAGPTAGVSNAGLAEPGVNLALFYAHITCNLMTPAKTNVDEIVAMDVLVKVRDRAIKALRKADRTLRKDEALIQREKKKRTKR